MVLRKGCSSRTFYSNIRQSLREGKPPAQATAIAYSQRDKSGCPAKVPTTVKTKTKKSK